MADVSPFRAYRYAPKAGRLDDLVTQPYDKISPPMRERYLSLSPHNLVRIILGERYPSDSAEDNVYTRAAGHLSRWIAEGVLVRDPEPAFFAYFQEFTVPDTGERLLRKGFIGLGAVEDYADGIVHRHEQTLSGPKQDRLELLRHTGAHFGQIFMLYPDPAGEVDAILDEAAGEPPAAEVADEYGATHRLWRISEPVLIASIQHAMCSKKLIIADGHHRYETALAFRNERPDLKDARRVMMTFVNMDSAGLRILATHRLVDNADPERFLSAARASFRIQEVVSLADLQRSWAEPHPGLIRLGVATPAGLHLLEAGREPGRLDVSFLHERILRDILGIGEEEVKHEKRIRYMRGSDAAVEEVRRGGAKVAFLLEATSVADVGRVAFSGGVMPQKSTDFYPKLLSGLTIYKLEG
ncbi:MAG: DUF1015 domain-containing protein [Bryobacteraceae bacterium]